MNLDELTDLLANSDREQVMAQLLGLTASEPSRTQDTGLASHAADAGISVARQALAVLATSGVASQWRVA